MIIPKRRKAAKMGLRVPSQVRSESHKKWVRGHECLIKDKAGHVCFGKIEAMHVRKGTNGGTGVKPGDNETVPGCGGAHKEQHTIGEPAFERKYAIDMREIAKRLWLASPHRIKWEMRHGH